MKHNFQHNSNRYNNIVAMIWNWLSNYHWEIGFHVLLCPNYTFLFVMVQGYSSVSFMSSSKMLLSFYKFSFYLNLHNQQLELFFCISLHFSCLLQFCFFLIFLISFLNSFFLFHILPMFYFQFRIFSYICSTFSQIPTLHSH